MTGTAAAAASGGGVDINSADPGDNDDRLVRYVKLTYRYLSVAK
jgi:hypothetical protein